VFLNTATLELLRVPCEAEAASQLKTPLFSAKKRHQGAANLFSLPTTICAETPSPNA